MTDERAIWTDDLACVEAVELFTDYLDGVLSEADGRRIEAHLATCPGCTEYLEQLRAVAGSLGGLHEGELPSELRDAVLAAYRDRRTG